MSLYVINAIGQRFKVEDREYTVTVNAAPAIDPPSNLSLSGSIGQSPSLSWTASSTSGVSYKLYRCQSYYQSCSSTESVITTTSSTSYTDNGVSITTQGDADDRYTYRVTATKNGEESGSSNSASTWGEGPQRIGEQQPALTFASLEADSAVPETHALNQNYPNPFNPSTEIRFDLPEAAEVLLVVYNVTGREVARLVNQSMGAGSHRVRWDAGDLPSGVYLYQLTAGNYTDTKSMTLLR